MNKALFPTLLLAGALGHLLAGCAVVPEYRIMVNTYLNEEGESPFPPGAAIGILRNKGEYNPLLENKLQDTIASLLVEAGFVSDSLEKADYGLRYQYRSGQEQVLKGYYEPDFWGPGYMYGYYGYYHPWGWYSSGRYVTYTQIEYIHTLQVSIFDAKRFRGDETVEMLWVGECMSLSPSPDLRTALAYMFRALFDHFGTDTGKGVEVWIRADDPRVLLLR